MVGDAAGARLGFEGAIASQEARAEPVGSQKAFDGPDPRRHRPFYTVKVGPHTGGVAGIVMQRQGAVEDLLAPEFGVAGIRHPYLDRVGIFVAVVVGDSGRLGLGHQGKTAAVGDGRPEGIFEVGISNVFFIVGHGAAHPRRVPRPTLMCISTGAAFRGVPHLVLDALDVAAAEALDLAAQLEVAPDLGVVEDAEAVDTATGPAGHLDHRSGSRSR